MEDLKYEIINHGFVADEIAENHYILGASRFAGAPALMPGGHGWSKYKPAPEIQNKNGVETMNCSNYGTHNALETLAAFLGFDDFPKDCSERYSGVGTGTSRTGNSPHTAIEIIRTQIGAIPEKLLPFDDTVLTWDEYYSPKPMSEQLLEIGKKLLTLFEIGHDWVFTGGTLADKQEKLMTALERGTCAVSVYAWVSKQTDAGIRYVKPDGATDNHWVQLLDYEQGSWWLVYDHYDDVLKYLEWDYNFGFAKVYYLSRLTQPQPTPSSKPFLSQIIEAFWKAVMDGLKRALNRS